MIKGFETKDKAQKSLDEQMALVEDKGRISVIAIDCSFSL